MPYSLGVDLGTSYTAAAVARDGRVDIASLGSQASVVPSVVLLKEDMSILTGDAANRRALTEPDRVAREFKRRVGDTTPIFLGGAPQSAEALMARLLRWVADEVAAREGGPAESLAISHPANWGQYKKDLLEQAVRIADLSDATYLTEPEAAAIHYASLRRIEPGSVIAVYDLGGGTFDAAVLRKTETGVEILGKPEGIERLGGVDFDAAVFAHVVRSLGGKIEELDEDDPQAIAAVARLRHDCQQAKEALSTDTDVTIPILLPNVQTEVRLTRQEFESMIRPSLNDSIGALRRALVSANVTVDDVSTVLLAGGSSRIPLIAQIVGAELGRPVAVDAHPKHTVALGAAIAAAEAAKERTAPIAGAAPGIAAAGAGATLLAGATDGSGAAYPDTAPAPVSAPAYAPVAASLPPTTPVPQVEVPSAAYGQVPVGPNGPGAPGFQSAPPAEPKGGRGGIIAIAAAGVALLLGLGAFIALRGGDDGSDAATATTAEPVSTNEGAGTAGATATTEAPATSETAGTTEPAATTTEAPATTESLPLPDLAAVEAAVTQLATSTFSTVGVALDERTVLLTGAAYDESTRDGLLAAANVAGVDQVIDDMTLQTPDEQCTETIRSQPVWSCVMGVTDSGGVLTANYVGSPDAGGAPYSLAAEHLHVFANTVEPITAGVPGPVSTGGGVWVVWDDPSTFQGSRADVGDGAGTADKLCVRIATGTHTLTSLDSGNCWPITS